MYGATVGERLVGHSIRALSQMCRHWNEGLFNENSLDESSNDFNPSCKSQELEHESGQTMTSV